jgi:hypothetical protein
MVHDSGLCRWACAGVELTTMADAVRVAWLVVVTEFSALVDRHGTRGCRKGDLAGQICLGWSVASSTPCWQRARCPPANPACHGSPCVELAACKASAVASWMPRPASAPAARISTHQCARSSIRPAAVVPRGCQKRLDAAVAQGGKMAAGGGILCMGVSLWGLLLKSRSSWWNGKLLMFGSTVRVIGGVYGCARTLADVLARVLSVTRFDS